MKTKKQSILDVLRYRSLNRFEAQAYGDHCLHSTVSALTAEGNAFQSVWEKVPTRFGKTRVKRYHLIKAAS